MPGQEENKQIVRRYVEAFNRGDLELLRELFAPDAVIFGVLGHGGFDDVAPMWRELHEGLAMRLHVEDMVAEGDVVAVRFTERGQSVGVFRGASPTGKSYEITAMEWFVVHEGAIHRRWAARDSGSIARQLGLQL